MASYLGIEVISQTAGETKVPGKNIPRAVILISFVAIFFAIALSTLAVGLISWQELSASFKDPIVALAKHLPFGSILAYFFAFMGFSILASTVNSGIVGISRIIFQASNEGLLPSILGKTSRRFRTPYVSIIIFSLISLILALSGQMESIAQLYNFGALLAYTLVCISLVALRIKIPQLFRPFRLPFSKKITYKNKVMEISLLGIFGVIATGGMWIAVIFLHTLGAIVGSIWMLFGAILYIIQKRRRKADQK
jgi:APA family basic amino acid/polyamine antiporter